MQSAQRTRWSRRPHGVRKQGAAFSTPPHRKSGFVPGQRGGGTSTSKQRRRTVGRERRRSRNLEEAARAKAYLQKSIPQSKRKRSGDYLHNLREDMVWKVARYANPRADMTIEALTDRDGKLANTSLVKEEMLRKESFPPNDGNQYYEQPPAGNAHTRVTEQAAKRALFSQSVKKALGPDKLSFSTIQLRWKWDKQKIVGLTRAAIRTGRHPAV